MIGAERMDMGETDMEGMEKGVLEDTLLQLATRLRERAFCRYVKDRLDYKELLQAACEAEKGYCDMELTNEQREQIDLLLESRANAEERELTLTYVAGILDGVAFLRKLGFLDMYVQDGQEKSC